MTKFRSMVVSLVLLTPKGMIFYDRISVMIRGILLTGLALVAVFNGLIVNAIVWKGCCTGLSFEDSEDEKDPEDLLVTFDRDQIHLGHCPQLWMHMYAAIELAPKNSPYHGNDAHSIFHSKQTFTINDGGTSVCQSPFSLHSISRILAHTTMTAFSRTNDWRSAMSTAIATMQKHNLQGATTAMVVRKLPLTHRNVVAVYNLGDSRVAHLRRSAPSRSYRVVRITQAQRAEGIPYEVRGDNQLFNARGIDEMEEYNFDVREDDLIIGASNGFWDSVKESETVHIADRMEIDSLAVALVTFAANREPKDDVTVIVGHLTPQALLKSPSDKD